MKTDYGWHNDGNGTNSSGFSGLPGGFRDLDGDFYTAGVDGYWWSSSPNGSFAWYRTLFYALDDIYSLFDIKLPGSGFSVRCVRDAE